MNGMLCSSLKQPRNIQYPRAFRPKDTGKGRKQAPTHSAVFERPPRDEYGLDMREAEWVRARPAERPLRDEYGLDMREAEWVRAQPAERPPRDEYGLDMREAEWVRAQPAERPLREEYGLDMRKAEWVRARPAATYCGFNRLSGASPSGLASLPDYFFLNASRWGTLGLPP